MKREERKRYEKLTYTIGARARLSSEMLDEYRFLFPNEYGTISIARELDMTEQSYVGEIENNSCNFVDDSQRLNHQFNNIMDDFDFLTYLV